MSFKKIGIVESSSFSKRAIDILKKIGRVYLLGKGDLESFLSDKEIIFIRLKHYIDSSFLDIAPKLKYICTPTTGLTHLDVDEIKRRNIKVISLRGEKAFLSNIRATPEHFFGLVLSLLRNYRKNFLYSKNKSWDREKYKGNEIFGNQVGIIGFGRVGKILAKYFHCFGAKVFFYDRDPEIEKKFNAIKLNSIKELISKTNIVLLCASYEKNNKHFFKKQYIDMLKNKFFINGSRGELIDEEYLIKKIKDNHCKGIALDVISNENNATNNLNKFIELVKERRNFILTPHIGGATFESMKKTEEFIALKIVNYINNFDSS